MITVYVWNYTGKHANWGHASMKVSGGTPAGPQYYSWWPEGRNRDFHIHESLPIYTVSAIKGRTYADDVRDEGGPPDHVVTISTLDETAVKDYWKGLISRSPNWSTLGQNCSTTVARSLMAGGGDEKVKWTGWYHQWNVVWKPDDVARYAKTIRDGKP